MVWWGARRVRLSSGDTLVDSDAQPLFSVPFLHPFLPNLLIETSID